MEGRLVVEIKDSDTIQELIIEGEHELGIEDAESDDLFMASTVESAVGDREDVELFDEE